jgi:hypothetical protein
MRKQWTKAETEEFIQLYPCTMAKDLAKRFNCSITQIYHKQQNTGVNKSTDFLHNYYKANFKGHPATQFKKGMTSWNKGTKGVMMGGVETQFKKGQNPHNTKPIGYRSYRDGYLVEKVETGFKFVHVLMWEAENGPVPKGLFVVFKDRNKANITLDNLELIDRHEHMRRNTVHNLPEELREVLHIKKSITRKINQLEKNGTQQN